MPESPKEVPASKPILPDDLEKKDSWEEDQDKRGYYYDDAHGYQVYVPEEDDDSQVDTEKRT